jgi:hypothetical protein
MSRRVLVVSHADADGHVIAEQARRNLSALGFDVETIVDPMRTKDHHAWLHLDSIPEIDTTNLVCFVDLMFAPATYNAEADALVRFAKARPKTKFFVFDHHPLPLRRLAEAPNVRATYYDDVFDCTVGPPSSMMMIAALCELPQPTRVAKQRTPADAAIARGMKRAAALGGPVTLAGKKLSTLLRFNRWKDIEALGKEDAAKHRLPRGRRRADETPSKLLKQLDSLADELISSSKQSKLKRNAAMAYDFDAATDRKAPIVTTYVPESRDLDAIVTIMQLAALDLTPARGTQFTTKELLERVRELGGAELGIREEDIKIVLGKSGFLKKLAGGKLVMK